MTKIKKLEDKMKNINGIGINVLGTGLNVSFSEDSLSTIQKNFLKIINKYKHIVICGNVNDPEKRGFINGHVYSLGEDKNKDITEEFGYNLVPTEIIRIYNELANVYKLILKDNYTIGMEYFLP